MTADQRTYATLDEWLFEQESFGVRAERVPLGAMPWIKEAWRLGAASVQKREEEHEE